MCQWCHPKLQVIKHFSQAWLLFWGPQKKSLFLPFLYLHQKSKDKKVNVLIRGRIWKYNKWQWKEVKQKRQPCFICSCRELRHCSRTTLHILWYCISSYFSRFLSQFHVFSLSSLNAPNICISNSVLTKVMMVSKRQGLTPIGDLPLLVPCAVWLWTIHFESLIFSCEWDTALSGLAGDVVI